MQATISAIQNAYQPCEMIGINGIWWSFLISETVTVVLAIIYLGIAEKKELI